MEQFAKSYKQYNDKLKHQNCISLTNYIKNVVDNQSDINRPIRENLSFSDIKTNGHTKRELTNYNTECIEFQSFINEINKSNDVHIKYDKPNVNSISTTFNDANNIKCYTLYQK